MRGYKAFDEGWKCKGMQYEIGKSYEMEEDPIICERGYHFCENPIDVFGYYPFDSLIAEVEAYGEIKQEGTKFVTNKIKIVREFQKCELQKLIRDGYCNSGNGNTGHYNSGNGNSGYYNSGDHNSGNRNSGDYNSGDYNSGNRNSGFYNSGYYNSGDHNSGNRNSGFYNSGYDNSGDYNSGDYNSGDYNSGDYNSGYYNSGDHNSGYDNSGDYNSGDYNSGNRNSGDYNSGNRNSGFYNSGDYNSGLFNLTEPTVRLFDNDSGITFREFFDIGIDLYDLESSKDKIMSLPNFDAEIFKKCTGLDWSEKMDNYKKHKD